MRSDNYIIPFEIVQQWSLLDIFDLQNLVLVGEIHGSASQCLYIPSGLL